MRRAISRCFLLISAIWLALPVLNAAGKAIGLSFDRALSEADVIAHIRVISDVQIIPWTQKADPKEYKKIATAKVLTPIKGSQAGDIIKLNHTNGLGCPNVIYRPEHEYIVFLKKSSDPGYFDTMNLYAGQFPIEDGMVLRFYLMPNYRHPDDLRLPLPKVLDFLIRKTAVKK